MPLFRALHMDVKDHIRTAGQEPVKLGTKILQALLPAGKHHAREYDITRDCRREHRTLPLYPLVLRARRLSS